MNLIKTFLSMVILMLVTFQTGCSGGRPHDLGINQGKLASCPDSPNCLSSQSLDQDHFVEPIPFKGEPTKAWQILVESVIIQKGATIITQRSNYLYAEFKSNLWGFIDDVECYLDQDQQVIHIRSASRLGYSDLGANGKRIEGIRKEFLDSISKRLP